MPSEVRTIFIGGEWSAAQSHDSLEVRSPTDGEVFGAISRGGREAEAFIGKRLLGQCAGRSLGINDRPAAALASTGLCYDSRRLLPSRR